MNREGGKLYKHTICSHTTSVLRLSISICKLNTPSGGLLLPKCQRIGMCIRVDLHSNSCRNLSPVPQASFTSNLVMVSELIIISPDHLRVVYHDPGTCQGQPMCKKWGKLSASRYDKERGALRIFRENSEPLGAKGAAYVKIEGNRLP